MLQGAARTPIRYQKGKDVPTIITGKTDRFNLSVVKDNFINEACFGVDFSHWLVTVLDARGVGAFVMGMDKNGWENVLKYEGETWLLHISGASDFDSARPNYGTWRLLLERQRSWWQKLMGSKNAAGDALGEKIAQILAGGRFEEVSIEA